MIRAGHLSLARAGLFTATLAAVFTLTATGAQAQPVGGSGGGSGGGNAVTGALRGITSLFNRGGAGSPATLPTSTIGIRGLGAEDIANAQPNPAAVGRAEALRVNADQARQFASTASLQARDVPALAQPPLPASGGRSGGAFSSPSDPNHSPN